MTLPTPADGEEFRPIPGYPGYVASSLGYVISYRRPTPRRMAGDIVRGGYRALHIRRGRQAAKLNEHVAVALAFLGPRPPGQEVRHLNGNPLDNRLSNLQYGTRSENAQDRIRHGRHWQTHKTRCPAGHPYDEANTIIRRRGHHVCRICRACSRERSRLNYLRRKAQAGGKATGRPAGTVTIRLSINS
jgi:hypothetical protein